MDLEETCTTLIKEVTEVKTNGKHIVDEIRSLRDTMHEQNAHNSAALTGIKNQINELTLRVVSLENEQIKTKTRGEVIKPAAAWVSGIVSVIISTVVAAVFIFIVGVK